MIRLRISSKPQSPVAASFYLYRQNPSNNLEVLVVVDSLRNLLTSSHSTASSNRGSYVSHVSSTPKNGRCFRFPTEEGARGGGGTLHQRGGHHEALNGEQENAAGTTTTTMAKATATATAT